MGYGPKMRGQKVLTSQPVDDAAKMPDATAGCCVDVPGYGDFCYSEVAAQGCACPTVPER